MDKSCGKQGGDGSAYRVLVKKSERKREFERPRRRREDNINMDFKK